MSLEPVTLDDVPDENERDVRLDERLGKVSALVECLKEDLVDTCNTLQALLDYFQIDRMELEYFKTTGRLRSYPPKASEIYQEVVKVDLFKTAEEVELLGVKNQLAQREDDVNEAVKKLDEVIAGIVEFNSSYDGD